MEFTWVAVAGLAVGLVCIAVAFRKLSAPRPDASEAIRRDIARLVQELQSSAGAQVERLDREIRRLNDAVAQAERVRAALETERALATAKSLPTPPRPPEKPANPLHSRVFELRDSGKDPADIGVETGLEVGEVELILGLRRMPPRA